MGLSISVDFEKLHTRGVQKNNYFGVLVYVEIIRFLQQRRR